MDQNNHETEQPKNQLTIMKVYGFAIQFGFVIALPLLAFIYIGKYLNERYDSKYFVLIGILLALTLTIIWITKRINQIRKDLK